MKKRIINLAMGLTALIASFLPQKAEALVCSVSCPKSSCWAIGWEVKCYCDADGVAQCGAS